MKRASMIKGAGVVAVAAGVVAAAVSLAPSGAPSAGAAQPIANTMQRDLGLTADQVKTRLGREASARGTAPAAKAAAGTAFGGAWYDSATGKLTVGVTDAAKAAAVRATGANAVQVENAASTLSAAKKSLDTLGQTAPDGVTAWYVDQKANTVVVNVMQGTDSPGLRQFLAQAKAAGPVEVNSVKSAPRTFASTVVGGDAYFINDQARCSIGFAVNDGFVSAGHCGSAGDAATDANGDALGTFEDSSFPGDDFSHVVTDEGVKLSPTVNGFGAGNVTVTGSTAAGPGESVCRSGSTTGVHCGTILATDQTVRYAEGTVTGLTATDVCAEPGDSGGSWVSGTEAQGVTSGGSGDCTSGGETFFQPLNEILQAGNLTLVTG